MRHAKSTQKLPQYSLLPRNHPQASLLTVASALPGSRHRQMTASDSESSDASQAPDGRLRICVLHPSYEDANSEYAEVDLTCTPQVYDKDGKYRWSHAMIKKDSAVTQVRELSLQGHDVFLNLCDGASDEDRPGVEVVEALERFCCAYTGADQVFYEPTKVHMKEVAAYHGVPTAPWAFVSDVDMVSDERALEQVTQASSGLPFPLIVKHHCGYGSVGMGRDCKVQDCTQLVQQVRKFVSQYGGALVEQFVVGREFTVLVAENADDPAQPLTFVPVECKFGEGEDFKHFDLKWKDYESMRWVPLSEEDSELDGRLRQASQRAFVAMKGCSYGRCDFRVDTQGNVFFLEINPNCGIFYPPHAMGSADYILSLDPREGHAGFLDIIVQAALARQRRTVHAETYVAVSLEGPCSASLAKGYLTALAFQTKGEQHCQ